MQASSRNLRAAFCGTLLCSSWLLMPPALAASESRSLGELSVMSVVGTYIVAATTESFVVESVTALGNGSRVVLKSVRDGSQATFEFSGRMASDLSLAGGTSVQLVAVSGGQLLVASGKVLGILPNDEGRALLHHSRHRDPA